VLARGKTSTQDQRACTRACHHTRDRHIHNSTAASIENKPLSELARQSEANEMEREWAAADPLLVPLLPPLLLVHVPTSLPGLPFGIICVFPVK